MRKRGIVPRLLCRGVSLLRRRRRQLVLMGEGEVMQEEGGWRGRWRVRLRRGRVKLVILVSGILVPVSF